MICRITHRSFLSLLILQIHHNLAAKVISKASRKYYRMYLVKPTLTDVFDCCKDLDSYAKTRPDLFNQNQPPLADIQKLCSEAFSKAQTKMRSALERDRLDDIKTDISNNVWRSLVLHGRIDSRIKPKINAISADLQKRYERAILENDIDPGVLIPWFCVYHDRVMYKYYKKIIYKFVTRFYPRMACYRKLDYVFKRPKFIVWAKCLKLDHVIATRNEIANYMHSVNILIFRCFMQIRDDKNFPSGWYVKTKESIESYTKCIKNPNLLINYANYCNFMGLSFMKCLQAVFDRYPHLLCEINQDKKDTVLSLSKGKIVEKDSQVLHSQEEKVSRIYQKVKTCERLIARKFIRTIENWTQSYMKYVEKNKDDCQPLLYSDEDD